MHMRLENTKLYADIYSHRASLGVEIFKAKKQNEEIGKKKRKNKRSSIVN